VRVTVAGHGCDLPVGVDRTPRPGRRQPFRWLGGWVVRWLNTLLTRSASVFNHPTTQPPNHLLCQLVNRGGISVAYADDEVPAGTAVLGSKMALGSISMAGCTTTWPLVSVVGMILTGTKATMS